MQTPGMTLRIEMFGALVDELAYWQKCLEEEEENEGDELEYCGARFEETLDSIREFREILLEDLDNYVKDCKEHNIPIDLGYWRIKKQLHESTFDVK